MRKVHDIVKDLISVYAILTLIFVVMAKANDFPLKKIAKLNPKITNWKIKAKLSFTNEKAKVVPFTSGSGKICRVVLEDKTSKIAGIAFGGLAEYVASKVTHNREYYITGAKIKNVYKTNNVGHGYELHFEEGTEFQDASNGKIICLDTKTVQSCEKKDSKAGTSSGTSRNRGVNLKPTRLMEVQQASQNLSNAQKFVYLTANLKDMIKEEKLKTPATKSRVRELKLWYCAKKKKALKGNTSNPKTAMKKQSVSKASCTITSPPVDQKGNTSNPKTAMKKQSVSKASCTITSPPVDQKGNTSNPKTAMKKQSVSKASCTITSPPVDQKGNTSNSKTAMKKQSVSKASCTITSPPVDQKGDFSQPDGNMAKSLKTESRKLESGVAKKKDNSGLAEKKRKLRSCSTSRGNKKHGEKLRKTDDNCVSYIDSEIFHKMQVGKQIGCIQFTRNNSCGTGFRVGSKYVITAYHVLEDIFRPFWKHVHNVLSVKERKEIKWTKDILPVAGSWNLSKFFSSLDPSKRELLLQAAKEMITDSCHIKMEFTKITGGTFFKFSHDPVAFASKKDDVLILELDDNQTLSAPLRLTEYCIPEAKLHVFGHPDNKILQHDRDCRIIEDRAELAEVVKEGISFFTEKGFDSEVVKEDYSPCKLSRNHILFHCSESIAHGASGAPLVVVTDIARVFGMLQTGHPKLYYNNHCKAKPLDGRPELLLEYGISMKKVKTLLESNSLFQLSNDLFSDESSSQMTQDVETLTLY